MASVMTIGDRPSTTMPTPLTRPISDRDAEHDRQRVEQRRVGALHDAGEQDAARSRSSRAPRGRGRRSGSRCPGRARGRRGRTRARSASSSSPSCRSVLPSQSWVTITTSDEARHRPAARSGASPRGASRTTAAPRSGPRARHAGRRQPPVAAADLRRQRARAPGGDPRRRAAELDRQRRIAGDRGGEHGEDQDHALGDGLNSRPRR